MSKQYLISGSISDGDLFTDEIISSSYSKCFISVEFFSDTGLITHVVPTAGTVTFTASEQGTRYGSIPNGVVTAASVESYDRPNFQGFVQKVKATCSSITGATHYRAVIAMF